MNGEEDTKSGPGDEGEEASDVELDDLFSSDEPWDEADLIFPEEDEEDYGMEGDDGGGEEEEEEEDEGDEEIEGLQEELTDEYLEEDRGEDEEEEGE
jgi:hypothetical protein